MTFAPGSKKILEEKWKRIKQLVESAGVDDPWKAMYDKPAWSRIVDADDVRLVEKPGGHASGKSGREAVGRARDQGELASMVTYGVRGGTSVSGVFRSKLEVGIRDCVKWEIMYRNGGRPNQNLYSEYQIKKWNEKEKVYKMTAWQVEDDGKLTKVYYKDNSAPPGDLASHFGWGQVPWVRLQTGVYHHSKKYTMGEHGDSSQSVLERLPDRWEVFPHRNNDHGQRINDRMAQIVESVYWRVFWGDQDYRANPAGVFDTRMKVYRAHDHPRGTLYVTNPKSKWHQLCEAANLEFNGMMETAFHGLFGMKMTLVDKHWERPWRDRKDWHQQVLDHFYTEFIHKHKKGSFRSMAAEERLRFGQEIMSAMLRGNLAPAKLTNPSTSKGGRASGDPSPNSDPHPRDDSNYDNSVYCKVCECWCRTKKEWEDHQERHKKEQDMQKPTASRESNAGQQWDRKTWSNWNVSSQSSSSSSWNWNVQTWGSRSWDNMSRDDEDWDDEEHSPKRPKWWR